MKKVVRKSSSLKEVTVYIDGGFEYLYILDGTNAVGDETNEVHVMDGRSRVARVTVDDGQPDEIRYNLEDHLGNAGFTVSGDGSLIIREEYFPFGETSFGSYSMKRYRFCGKERDEESGLCYYGARYYACWACRFASIDPLAGKYPFYTPYQYAGNKPIVSIDIDGLEGDNETGDQKAPRRIPNTRSMEPYRIPQDQPPKPGDKGEGPIIPADHHGEEKHEEAVENSSFAIYVAFSDQTAAVGKNDKSMKARITRAKYGNKQLPVEHAGVIIGDGVSGRTYYFDFGRFDPALYAQREGKGITRSSITNSTLSTINATFDEEGNVTNSEQIVRSLVHGSDSYFDTRNYGTVEYGVYLDPSTPLDFGKMYDFATNHGNRVFGIEGENTFCAKFANQTIIEGGGKMPNIEVELDELLPELLRMYAQGRSEREIALRGPVPSNMAAMIRKRFPKVHKEYKKLKC